MRDLERCDREIAEVERLLRGSHRDVEGLCRALIDWSVERRILMGSLAVEKPGQTVEGGLAGLAGGEGRGPGPQVTLRFVAGGLGVRNAT
jgi:hypothetical protein